MALSTKELMVTVEEVNKLDSTKVKNQNLDLFSMDIEKCIFLRMLTRCVALLQRNG